MRTAIDDAVNGRDRDLGYPLPGARNRARVFFEDAASFIRGLPAMVRAVVATLKIIRDEPRAPATDTRGRRARQLETPSATPVPPGIPAFIAASEWKACAKALGGSDTSLFFALAARLAARVGWVGTDDNQATVAFSISEREEDDLRANALTDTMINVDPTLVTESLSTVRSATRRVIVDLRTAPNPYLVVMPLITVIPKRVIGAMIEAPVNRSRPPTTAASMGTVPATVFSPDGTPAERTWFRVGWSPLGRTAQIARREFLYLNMVKMDEQISILATTNLLTGADVRDQLREAVAEALKDLGVIDVSFGDLG